MIQRKDDGAASAAPRNRVSNQDQTVVAPVRSPRREVQVGIFVLIGVLALLAALFTLTDPGTFRGRYYVTAVVRDAEGIRRGDPVQMLGVNIGRVRGFEIIRDRAGNPNGVQVRLELEGNYRVPQDSKVQLTSSGLMGGVTIAMVRGSSAQRLQDGDVLQEVPELGGSLGMMDQAEQLAPKASALMTRTDTILMRAQQALSQQTVGAVQASAVELQNLVGELSTLAEEQRRELQGLTSSLRRSAQGLEGATTRPELARAIARTDSITIALQASTAQLNAASTGLAGVIGRIERGEGTLGKLSRDQSLYDNMNRTVTEFGDLAEDIQANPRKYVSVRVF
jgi:phospholipid/cholesterol/gamma-HCH transport system substrate-binding protein